LSKAIEQIVNAYVGLGNRRKLEELLTYRRKLAVDLKMKSGFDFSLLIKSGRRGDRKTSANLKQPMLGLRASAYDASCRLRSAPANIAELIFCRVVWCLACPWARPGGHDRGKYRTGRGIRIAYRRH